VALGNRAEHTGVNTADPGGSRGSSGGKHRGIREVPWFIALQQPVTRLGAGRHDD
jgi:hypothetical protein